MRRLPRHLRRTPTKTKPVETAEAVLQFLKSVGPRAESELYLREYRSAQPEAFATICVDAQVMSSADDGLAFDLRLLHSLGLMPVVVFGLLEPASVAGHARALAKRLANIGVRSEGPFSSEQRDKVRDAARSGALPILGLGQASAEVRLDAVRLLLHELMTRKLVFLRETGGLRAGGERISLINLSTEVEALRQQAALSEAELSVLAAAEGLVLSTAGSQRKGPPLTASITSPLNLLHELFTVRGAGTLLRRGAQVATYDGLGGVDETALVSALEASFGRPMGAGLRDRCYERCYVADAYRGVALTTACPFGGYLDKFAVTPLARGEGVGRDLWQAVVSDYPRLLWRARAQNPVTGWYEQQSDGRFRRGAWTVYTRGVEPDDLAAAIAFAVAQPEV